MLSPGGIWMNQDSLLLYSWFPLLSPSVCSCFPATPLLFQHQLGEEREGGICVAAMRKKRREDPRTSKEMHPSFSEEENMRARAVISGRGIFPGKAVFVVHVLCTGWHRNNESNFQLKKAWLFFP